MKKTPRLAFVLATLTGLAGACTRREAPKALPAAATPLATNVLTIAPFDDESDPRREWLHDLVEPRLARVSSLSWHCGEDGNSIDIDLAPLHVRCEEFLRVSFPLPLASPKGASKAAARAMQPSCRKETAHIPLREPCIPGEKPALLARLRLPAGSGLFLPANRGVMKPKVENLPDLEFPTSGFRRIQTPDLKIWLASAGLKGAILLTLQPVRFAQPLSEGTVAAWAKATQEFLSKAKAPKLIHPNPELVASPLAASAGAPATPPTKLPWLVVSDNYRESLYHETCAYLSRWLKTRQLLSPSADMDTTREWPLRCVFSWAEEPLPEGTIIVARLPLPLSMEDSSYFPFKTVEDALSPSLFQSLKLAR